MINLHLFLVLLFGVAVLSQEADSGACVRDQAYWRDLPQSAWPVALQSATLCGGTPWYDLMQIELLELMSTQSRDSALWLVTFHQTCVAALNQAAVAAQTATPPSLRWATLVEVILHSLEAACDNTGGWSQRWQYDPTLRLLLSQLQSFNRGEILPQFPTCDVPPTTTNSSNATTVEVPYASLFGNMSDLFLVVLPNNETVPAGSTFFQSVLAQTIQVKILLAIFIGCSIILGIKVGAMWLVYMRNKKRELLFSRRMRDDARDDTMIDLDNTSVQDSE